MCGAFYYAINAAIKKGFARCQYVIPQGVTVRYSVNGERLVLRPVSGSSFNGSLKLNSKTLSSSRGSAFRSPLVSCGGWFPSLFVTVFKDKGVNGSDTPCALWCSLRLSVAGIGSGGVVYKG